MALIVENSQDDEMSQFRLSTQVDKASLVLVMNMQEGNRSIYSELISSNIAALIENFNADFYVANSKFVDEEKNKLMRELEEYNLKILDKRILRKYKTIYLAGVSSDKEILEFVKNNNTLNIRLIEDACSSLKGQSSHQEALTKIKEIVGERNVVTTGSLLVSKI